MIDSLKTFGFDILRLQNMSVIIFFHAMAENYGAAMLKVAIDQELKVRETNLVLDVSSVSYFDPTALGHVFSTLHHCKKAGTEIALVGADTSDVMIDELGNPLTQTFNEQLEFLGIPAGTIQSFDSLGDAESYFGQHLPMPS